MQSSRREFVKKAAIVTAGTVASTAVLTASAKTFTDDSDNGVVKGSSPKKEILYKKTAAWQEFYKNAE